MGRNRSGSTQAFGNLVTAGLQTLADARSALDESGERLTLREYRGRAEKEYILQTLDEVGWNISRAATILGVERTNLHKKMRSYGIRRAET